MVSLEAFSELLEVLYSAPLQQEDWEHFLALLSKRTHSSLSVFLCADNRLGVSCRAQGGSSPQARVDALAYNERYVQNDPFRAPCLQNPTPRIVEGDDLLPNEGLLSTDLYRDLLEPQGCRYATLIILTLTVRRIELITIWRTIDQGPMDADSNHFLNLLFPHIQKALEIRQVLGVAQQRLAGAETMADASSTPTFLLSRHGRVVHRNAAAARFVSQGGPLAISNDTLVATASQARKELRALLLKAADAPFSGSIDPPAHALPLARTPGSAPLHLLVTQLPQFHRQRLSAELMLLISDPDNTPSFPDNVLCALYGLTPAESEVANGLLMGYSLQEIANLRRVSLGTTRMQLKSLLNKTGATRQSELVPLLMSLPQVAM